MKICICTTPIRRIPTDYPPFGSMSIIQSLRKIGKDARFYNIDYFRYSHNEIKAYFKINQFDIVGISAVVSTAYAYTKYLSSLINRVSPNTLIIVGGNLAASAEILLRKCKVDICVVGDGELTIQALVRVLNGRPLNLDTLRTIKGICYLEKDGEFFFTGYGEILSSKDIEWPDYSILDADGSLPHFISDNIDERLFGYDGVVEFGKKVAWIVTAKGCVNQCTFCHRWEKGYRVRPSGQVIEHVRYLIKQYNVGCIIIADENFGSDINHANEVASGLGALGVIWSVAGVRTRTVSKESLQHWKDSGCYMAIFGVESGSLKMLRVMEKNATVEMNTNAIKWTGEVGLGTIIQLVIGMPGENDKTIEETIEFLKEISSSVKWWKGKTASDLISINYAQALPGTPLYEYARQHGLIGADVNEEEKYLINISDIDAYHTDHFVNATDLPLLQVLTWRPLITAHLDAHHYRSQYGVDNRLSLLQVAWYYIGIFWIRLSKIIKRRFSGILKRDVPPPSSMTQGDTGNRIGKSGYFNIHAGFKYAPLLFNPITAHIFKPLLLITTAVRFSKTPMQILRLLFANAFWSMKFSLSAQNLDGISLRKTIAIMPSKLGHNHDDKMLPLRKGR